ncbi:MAG: hypothetical protein JNL82_41660 [Myxococcales bacterium]|nr:hypothetical protein [Myxococcales bacterium]
MLDGGEAAAIVGDHAGDGGAGVVDCLANSKPAILRHSPILAVTAAAPLSLGPYLSSHEPSVIPVNVSNGRTKLAPSVKGASARRIWRFSPEVVRSFSDADAHSDQFSLGALLGHILIGRPLFDSTEKMIRRGGVFTRIRDVNASFKLQLDRAVGRMLEVASANRYPDLREAIDAVTAAIAPAAPEVAYAGSSTPRTSPRTPASGQLRDHRPARPRRPPHRVPRPSPGQRHHVRPQGDAQRAEGPRGPARRAPGPAPAAAHILAHQILALCLQERGISRHQLRAWLATAAPFRDITPGDLQAVVDTMLARDILYEADGRLVLGSEGEKSYGRRAVRRDQKISAVPSAGTCRAPGRHPRLQRCRDRSLSGSPSRAASTRVTALDEGDSAHFG